MVPIPENVKNTGIHWQTIYVDLLGSENAYMKYPVRGWLQIHEVDTAGRVTVAAFVPEQVHGHAGKVSANRPKFTTAGTQYPQRSPEPLASAEGCEPNTPEVLQGLRWLLRDYGVRDQTTRTSIANAIIGKFNVAPKPEDVRLAQIGQAVVNAHSDGMPTYEGQGKNLETELLKLGLQIVPVAEGEGL